MIWISISWSRFIARFETEKRMMRNGAPVPNPKHG